jgi:hypothetical protein
MIGILNTPWGLYVLNFGGKSWLIPPAYIRNIRVKKTDRYKLLFSFYPDEFIPRQKLEINYDDVVFPLSANPQDLVNKIYDLNTPKAGIESFVAQNGQTEYTIQKDKFFERTFVLVNGVGLADNAYTAQGSVVTFLAPFAGGEEVKVITV